MDLSLSASVPQQEEAARAITSRRSVRAFLPKSVPRQTISAILEVASRAPSGSNMQPWQVLVLTGAPLVELTRELHSRALQGDQGHENYRYYPKEWREPYLSRRRKVGWDLYSSLGIGRTDRDKMSSQLARNFLFFDAPVGLLFLIDDDLEVGSWLDYGMFLQNIMIAARGFGLDTCPQQAFARYQQIIFERLLVPSGRTLVCGMALGFADPEAVENNFVTEREPVANFVRFFEGSST